MVAQRAGTPPPAPVLLSGIVPPLADSYYQRPETGLALRSGLYPGDTVVLTHGEESAHAPAAQGGTGKTQLAVAYTHALWSLRAVEVLIWVTATNREAIITGFAEAAGAVGAAEPGTGAEAAADRLIAWLAQTRRPWALVIDDLSDAGDLENLWPAGPAGQVVITTRLPGEALRSAAIQNSASGLGTGSRPGPASGFGMGSGPGSSVPGLRIAPVDGFNRREALSYLSSLLTDYPDQRMEALELGEDLDGLPLGLAQAAAVIKATRLSCRDYRAQFAERREHMSRVPAYGVSPEVLATWSLAAECAHALVPAGLAWPALTLAAMLDPHGIPGAVLTSPAACGYIMGRPSNAGGTDQDAVRAAVANLARVGLVSIDPASPVRTVLMHSSVQAAVRAYLPDAELGQAQLAAADALIQTWPEAGGGAQLDQALREGTSALWTPQPAHAPAPLGTAALGTAGTGPQPVAGLAGAPVGPTGGSTGRHSGPPRHPLWAPEAHPLLFRQGLSLEYSGLTGSAIAYWQAMLMTSTRLLGAGHANATVARDRLAAAYEAAGRFVDAIAVFEGGLADRERTLGLDHPETIRARGHLAHAYLSAGRPTEAVALYEQMITAGSRQLGLGHPVTLAARSGLAGAFLAAGRDTEALASYLTLTTDAMRILGASHPTTLAARENLAAGLLASRRAREAIEQYQRLLTDTEAAGGPDHPDTIATRAHLATAYLRAGRPVDAIQHYERALADGEHYLGPDHPVTRTVRANLDAAKA